MSNKNISIGFIGLGVMGFHMAGHLLQNNFCLNILRRNSVKTKKFISKFGNNKNIKVFSQLSELAHFSNVIISCVGNDNDLNTVYLKSDGIIKNIKEKSIIIDHTTASEEISIKLFNEFKKKKCFFFDAPISGGENGAMTGKLSIMVGGDKKVFNKLKKILDPYSKSLVYMGKCGSGQITKMVNQICVASVIQGLAEGLTLAKAKKLDIDSLIEVISNGAAQSWQLENRALSMWKNKFNFGFMNKLMLKDLNIILKQIKKNKINLPVTKKIKLYYQILVNNGFEKEDTSNLIRLLKR
tara:strand:- start:81 stop:971 length:891 start_codon:yes stop_codon:yes gene_type:complete